MDGVPDKAPGDGKNSAKPKRRPAKGNLAKQLVLTPSYSRIPGPPPIRRKPHPHPASMKILIAPDKFKGCLTAPEAAELMAEGVRMTGADHDITLLPIADGGEGTADTVRAALHGVWIEAPSHDARGCPITGRYAWIESERVAVIEMSTVAGLTALAPAERDPLTATTFGVGELMNDARRRGARRIIVGLGGSATNDAGVGMAVALGWRFRPLSDATNAMITPRDFPMITELIAPARSTDNTWPEIIGACDVTNPLLGSRGATRVYGPQKGATPADLETLENALRHVADLVASQPGRDRRNGRDERDTPGVGAAGGLGYGLLTFAGARLTSGFNLVAELIGLEAAIARCDLVLTGEGCLDAQTLDGKGLAGVAALARCYGKPIIALAGRVREEARTAGLFDQCVALANDDVPTATAIREAAFRLRAAAHHAVL